MNVPQSVVFSQKDQCYEKALKNKKTDNFISQWSYEPIKLRKLSVYDQRTSIGFLTVYLYILLHCLYTK